jgi:hypothetical protein
LAFGLTVMSYIFPPEASFLTAMEIMLQSRIKRLRLASS